MSAQPNVRGFLLELAADGIAPVIGGCAGAIVAGPGGVPVGTAAGRVVEKAINYFGPKIIENWLCWFRCQPKKVQIDAVAELGSVPIEEARQVASAALDRLVLSGSPKDKSVALEYLAAIPEAVQQSLVLDLTTGGKTVPPSLSIESSRSLMQLLPTDVPPYAAPTLLPGTKFFLKRVVGTGGFGVVYEAVENSLQHLPLAIKFCLDSSMLEMLKREEGNLKRLMDSAKGKWSPHIVRLYGCEFEHATPFLVYEFVPGGTLTNYLTKRREETGGSLSPEEVLGLIRQITEALAFAHERRLVHRDLKPANVLVDGTALKLADFGIGGIVADYAADHSQIGHSLVNQLRPDEQKSVLQGSGTPLYMDPDQRCGVLPNPKHDLYSLGVVWYQLLIGDVRRELHAGWAEELASEFKVPKNHIEILKQCVGWIKNRPNSAGELLKLLPPPGGGDGDDSDDDGGGDGGGPWIPHEKVREVFSRLSSNPNVVDQLKKLHELVLEVCSDCLIGQRGDGALIYVPPKRQHAGKRKNLLTMWAKRAGVRMRIMPDPEEMYDPSSRDAYLKRLRRLYGEMGGRSG